MDLLDTRQLRAFHELARHRSFTSAARALHLTQSAVSHSIKALETTLEVTLFERQGKTVRLTPVGERLLPHAHDILSRMQRALDVVDAWRHPGHGRLAIGATTTISHAILPSVLREFRECFPHYEITIATDDTRQLLKWLGEGKIDLAIGMALSDDTSFRFESLFCDTIAMAMAPIHPLSQRNPLTPTDLADQSFIFYGRQSETFRVLEQGFKAMKGSLRGHLQVGSMAAIKEMAKIGLGIGLLAPWVIAEETAAGTLVSRPLPWKPLRREWGFYTSSHRDTSQAEHVFKGLCGEVVQGLSLQTSTATSAGAQH